jgi:hypothetical protein
LIPPRHRISADESGDRLFETKSGLRGRTPLLDRLRSAEICARLKQLIKNSAAPKDDITCVVIQRTH